MCEMRCFGHLGLLESGIFLTIGGHAVSVNRIVVVQRAVGVHVASVVGVRRVRRPERIATTLICYIVQHLTSPKPVEAFLCRL